MSMSSFLFERKDAMEKKKMRVSGLGAPFDDMVVIVEYRDDEDLCRVLEFKPLTMLFDGKPLPLPSGLFFSKDVLLPFEDFNDIEFGTDNVYGKFIDSWAKYSSDGRTYVRCTSYDNALVMTVWHENRHVFAHSFLGRRDAERASAIVESNVDDVSEMLLKLFSVTGGIRSKDH